MENLALATLLIPFAGAAVAAFVSNDRAKWIAQAAAAATLAAVLLLAIEFAAAGKPTHTLDLVTVGSAVLFGVVVDRLSVLVAIAVIGIGLLVCVYSAAYLSPGNREHPHAGRRNYYAFLLGFIGAMAGLVFSSTLVGQLFFFEVTGACSWALIGYYETPKSLRSAAKALVVTHIASLGLYIAAATLFAATGSFALSGIAGLDDGMKAVVLLAILVAAWGKSAQLPFHMWLPDAMEAPTPISAYLHAASMVKVGVYIFARSLSTAGHVPEVVGWVGTVMAVLTLVYGFAMYLPQTDLKRLLAYSTITQLSYIFFALSLSVFGSQLAFDGAIAHVFNHAFAKGLFFLVAGALSYTTGTRLLPQLRGLLGRAPLLAVGFCVAALAVTGVPPFNGFFSKFVMFAGGFEAAREHPILLALLVVALLESIGSFAWFLRCVGASVPGAPSPAVAVMAPLPASMKGVLIVLIVMTLLSSFIAAAWLG